ncbi:MAG: hypothetical protein HND57_02410 [Planctomycetes bacterium]|nr:hypothetical protein [Planctomycetota bacterium]
MTDSYGEMSDTSRAHLQEQMREKQAGVARDDRLQREAEAALQQRQSDYAKAQATLADARERLRITQIRCEHETPVEQQAKVDVNHIQDQAHEKFDKAVEKAEGIEKQLEEARWKGDSERSNSLRDDLKRAERDVEDARKETIELQENREELKRQREEQLRVERDELTREHAEAAASVQQAEALREKQAEKLTDAKLHDALVKLEHLESKTEFAELKEELARLNGLVKEKEKGNLQVVADTIKSVLESKAGAALMVADPIGYVTLYTTSAVLTRMLSK